MKKTFLNIFFAISLLALTTNTTTAIGGDCGYAVAADTVKYCDQVIPGADIPTFKPEPYYSIHATDKNHAYFRGRIIEGAHPETFQMLDAQKSKDANSVFCEDKVLTTDVQNFKLFKQLSDSLYDPNLSLDGSAVYYGCDKLENSDPKTLTRLSSKSGYANFYKDKNNVYYQQYRLEADPNTFQDLGRYYGKDVNAVYFQNTGKVAGADVATFHANLQNFVSDPTVDYNQITTECNNLSYDAYDDFNCYVGGVSVIARNKGAVITPKRQKPYFSDIQKDFLDYFYERGIFTGYTDGTFGFNTNLTRAELIKIVMVAHIIPNSTTNLNCFSDVKSSDWFAPYICTAKEKGFIQGYADGTYKPHNRVNKVEALKMIAEVMGWPMGSDSSLEGTAFKDTDKNEWYYKYVIYALNSFFIEMSSDYKYYPANAITRGEAAEILFRTLVSQFENGLKSKEDYEMKRRIFLERYESSKQSQ